MEDKMLNMNGMKNNIVIFMIILFSVITAINIYAQENNNYYPAQIIEIQKENIKKWFFIRPISGDITVRWRLSGDDNRSEFDHYRVYCENTAASVLIDSSDVLNVNDPYTFLNKQAGIRWKFYIKGFTGSSYHTISDTSYTIIGQTRNYVRVPNVIKLIFLGKLPLSLLGKGEKYENASVTGKVAFFVLWIFMLTLVPFIILFLPRLNYNRVFPIKEGKYVKKAKLLNKDIDRVLSDEFSKILDYWRTIFTHSKEQINSEINKRLKKNEEISISEVEGANVKHWADEGMKGIQKLIKEINDREKWKDIPTVNIFKVGLESHEINGYHWIEVSKEVDRAIENRAASEIEILRRKSHVDWLWNIGTLAPIVGLFGTATGISKVFDDIQPSISQGQQMITELSGGINEALWTTIEGLAISFIFLMVYYYFNNKLKRIYMKWENLYVTLSEKIHDIRNG